MEPVTKFRLLAKELQDYGPVEDLRREMMRLMSADYNHVTKEHGQAFWSAHWMFWSARAAWKAKAAELGRLAVLLNEGDANGYYVYH